MTLITVIHDFMSYSLSKPKIVKSENKTKNKIK